MINEHDIADMKALYELPRNTKFKLADDEIHVPPASGQFSFEEVYTFDHIDGMYSMCFDSKGVMHNFAAWTKVITIEKE